MTPNDIKAVVLEEIDNVAPGALPDDLDGGADMREAIDLDSMDILNLVTALHQRLNIDIPEKDVPKLVTLDGAVAYLTAKLG